MSSDAINRARVANREIRRDTSSRTIRELAGNFSAAPESKDNRRAY